MSYDFTRIGKLLGVTPEEAQKAVKVIKVNGKDVVKMQGTFTHGKLRHVNAPNGNFINVERLLKTGRYELVQAEKAPADASPDVAEEAKADESTKKSAAKPAEKASK